MDFSGNIISYYNNYNKEGNPNDYFCQYNGNKCIETQKISSNTYEMKCSNKASISNWFFLVLFLILLLVLIFVIKTKGCSDDTNIEVTKDISTLSPYGY